MSVVSLPDDMYSDTSSEPNLRRINQEEFSSDLNHFRGALGKVFID